MNYSWHWERLPVELQAKVIDLYYDNNWLSLMEIHNEYNLSIVEHCCCDECVRLHVKDAIDKGVISK